MPAAMMFSTNRQIKIRRGAPIAALYLFLFAVTPAASPQAKALAMVGTKRRITIADAIEMTRAADQNRNGSIAHFSPDRKRFVIVVKRGDLSSNTNEYSLLLWKSSELFHSRFPRLLLRLSSSSNRGAIDSVSWLGDNETLCFLGEHPGELHQLYSFNIRTKKLKRLIAHPANLVAYSITHDGRYVAYTAAERATRLFDAARRRYGLVVNTESIYEIAADRNGGPYRGDNQLYFEPLQKHAKYLRLNLKGRLDDWSRSVPYLSPDGKYVVIATHPTEDRPGWSDYADQFIHGYAVQRLRKGQYSSLEQYELIDTKTGTSRHPVDAPIGDFGGGVIWSPDSRFVVIAGTYLPLRDTSDDERRARQIHEATVEIAIPGATLRVISSGRQSVLDSKWERRDVLCDIIESGHSECLRRLEAKWERGRTTQLNDSLPVITIQESMGEPPRVVATKTGESRPEVLLDLNPQFDGLEFGKVEEVTWKSENGTELKGGLYYPVDYVPGQRYPLVIQTHGWTATKFWMDGPFTTAFAAQPLASAGIMVWQADESFSKFNTPDDAPLQSAALERAIDYLDQRGLIDPDRIGIIGFSATCFHVKFLLTHSRYAIAAAAVADGPDGGYLPYLLLQATARYTDGTQFYEGVNGGLPWGDTLKQWVERSPGFSIDKVRTPIRITALTAAGALNEWEWYAALSRLGRPVEMVVIENGSHVLEKPWDRMVSQQGNVDWFRFWLKGQEDPDPMKRAQYFRWEELRRGMNPQHVFPRTKEIRKQKIDAPPTLLRGERGGSGT